MAMRWGRAAGPGHPMVAEHLPRGKGQAQATWAAGPRRVISWPKANKTAVGSGAAPYGSAGRASPASAR